MNNPSHLAYLHCKLLPDSPITGLGENFARTYYKYLQKGYIYTDIYEVSGNPVAFSSYTFRPHSFMRDGFLEYWYALIPAILIAIIAKHRRIKTVIKMLSLGHKRQRDRKDYMGEQLSFGVLEEYRTCEVGGKFISQILFERVLERFAYMEFSMQMTIKKDNFLSLLFFRQYGFRVIGDDYVDKDKYLLTNSS